MSTLENRRSNAHILQGAVGARADADLIHFHAGQLFHGFDIARTVRTGGQWLNDAQIQVDDPIVVCLFVGFEFHPVLLALLGLEERASDFVGREDGRGHAHLRTHVGDGGALWHGEGGHAGTAVLKDYAYITFGGQAAEHMKHHVLSGNPGAQTARKTHKLDLGSGQIEVASAHGHGHIKASRPDGDLTQAAARGRMAVAAQKGRSRLAEALQVNLMADAVAGPGEGKPVVLSDSLKVAVVVGILKAHLHRVVVHIRDRQISLKGRQAHGLELEVGHGARGILGQGLINADANLRADLVLAGTQVALQYLLDNVT